MKHNKTFFKIVIMECIFMLVSIVVACLAALVQLVGKTYMETYSSYIFRLDVYRYNTFAYIGGILIYFVYLWFAYKKILGKYITLMMDYNNVCKVFFGIVCGVFLFAMFIALVMVMFVTLGLSRDMRPEYLMFATYIGWPVVTLFLIGIDIARKI